MGRLLPGSTPISPRVVAGMLGTIGLLFGFTARADEFLKDKRVENAPPLVEVTVILDSNGEAVSTTTDARGRGRLALASHHWHEGSAQLVYLDPVTHARVANAIELDAEDPAINVDYRGGAVLNGAVMNSADTRRGGPWTRSLNYSLGVGWGREIHENSPSGGGIILQGRADYPLNANWSVGAGAGYYWLGSTTTTWSGQTGEVTLAANPLWGELVYDFRGTALLDEDRDEGGNYGGVSREWVGGLRPYAVAGGGPYWRRTGGDFESENDSSLNFGLNVGLGVDNLSHQGAAGIGLEARYHNVIQDGLHGFQMFTFNANVKF